MSRSGFHIRLRVEGGAIQGIHLGAILRCSDGSRGTIEIRQEKARLAIDPDGRFRDAEDGSTPYGTETQRFEGTVRPDRIVGTFKYEEREGPTCRTGGPGDPQIHFIARRRG
jgi:hypothetical protein